MSRNDRHFSILNISMILVIVFSLVPYIRKNASVQAQANPAFIRKVRVMEPDKTGLSRPAGLAFSSHTNSFQATEAGPASAITAFTRLTPFGHRVGSINIARSLQDPINLAYDSTFQRLLLLQSPKQMFELKEDADGNLSPPTLARYDIRSWGLQNPNGLAIDPGSGNLFILDAGPRILWIQPAPDGSFSSARVTTIDLLNSGLGDLRGLAFDPTSGHLHVLSPVDQNLYELDVTGNVQAVRRLADFGIGTPQAILFAPTTDQTDEPGQYSLFVTDSGQVEKIAKSGLLPFSNQEVSSPTGKAAVLQDTGQIVEFSLQAAVAAATADFTSSLVHTTDMSQSPFNPPSPDPSGLTYLPNNGTLLTTDGEVEETVNGVTHFQGANVWEITLGGSVVRTANISKVSPTVVPMTNEPTGVAWNPNTGHFFVTDDDDQRVYDLDPGADGLIGTNDDGWTYFGTLSVGNGDPEGIAYNSWNNHIFTADGVNQEIYEYTTAGTLVNHFDVSVFGVLDPESVEFNPNSGTLFVLSNHNSPIIVETSTSGVLLQTIDVSAGGAYAPAGLTYAPGSDGSGTKSFYIVDRGIDNNDDPNIIDGKMYEMTAPSPITPGNTAPVVNAGLDQSVTLPDTATLNGTAQDDGIPNPPGSLTITWSQIGGPGSVTFNDPNALLTTASFSSPGSYLLRLTASDGELSSSDDIVVTVFGSGGTVATDVRVSASSDDAEESASGSMSLASSDLELVYDGSNQTVGMRFTGIAIPNQAVITNAYIQFMVDEIQTEATSLIIQGETADNPGTFTSSRLNISSRSRTAASSTWAPPGWTTTGEAGLDQRTPDISPIIQEIVNRPNWSGGNALVIIITGTGHRTAVSYDKAPGGAPLLHIEYLPANPTNTPSPTPTDTPTPFPTNTNTPTATATYTPSNTPTNTNTPTDTPTPAASDTPTPLSTSTNTPTGTATYTLSPTPTNTNTPTPTNTPSPAPSDTPTPTSTGMDTPTNTPTTTAIATDTPSPSITLSFAPSDDARVQDNFPSTNFGSSPSLRVRSSNAAYNSYLKFVVSGLTAPVQSARLRLYVSDASPVGGSIYLVSNDYLNSSTPWAEGGLTWNNAPTISGSPLSTLGPVALDTFVEFDVTAAIQSDGTYSFGINSTSQNDAWYNSTEAANPPVLIVDLASNP